MVTLPHSYVVAPASGIRPAKGVFGRETFTQVNASTYALTGRSESCLFGQWKLVRTKSPKMSGNNLESICLKL